MEAMETVQQEPSQAMDKTKALQLVLLRCLTHGAYDFSTNGDDLILETSEETVVIHFHLVSEPKPLQHDDLDLARAVGASAKYFIFTNCPVDQLNVKDRAVDKFGFLNLTNIRELATEHFYVDRIPSDLNPSITEALQEFTSQRGISRFFSQLILNRFHSYLKLTRGFTRSDIKLALLELFIARYKVDLSYDTRISYSELWADITRDSPLIAVESEFASETFLKSHTAGVIAKFGDSSEIAYRNLWVSGEVALLLSTPSSKDHLNVVNILKAFSAGVKVTVLTVSGHESVLCLNEEQSSGLLKCEANLQGKSTFRLGEFMEELTSLKASDAIRVITNNLIVDYCYKKPPEYFIERSCTKVIIRLDAVASLVEETFVVKDEVDGVNVSLGTVEGLSNLVIVKESPVDALTGARETGRPVHLLVSCGENWLEWRSSWGCTDGIKKFDISQELRLEGNVAQLARDRECTVRLLAMEASMGKSTVLDHLALSMTDRWVLGVDLNRYLSEDYRKIDLVDLYRFCTQDSSELAQLLFGKFADAKNVEVLFDNYDQAILNHSDKALELLTSLQQKNVGLWIIASGKNAGKLEKQLATIAIPLNSFNIRNSRDFFVRYFGMFAGSQKAEVNTFVETLLRMLRREIDAFLDSPLYLTLIANIYMDDFKHFVLTGGLRLEDNFQLINFLETFTTAYVNYLTDKYDLCDNKFFSHRLPILALRAVFDPSDLLYYLKEDALAEFAKEGIVECELPHAIMAQFLSAKWMYQNLSSRRILVRALNKRRFSDLDRYRGTFTIFDLMLARDLPLHTMLIRSKLKYNPAETYDSAATDLGGRNAVHMAALYGVCHPRTNIVRGIDLNDHLVTIVTLADRSVIEADDTLLGYSALDYALSSGCLAVANAICEKSPQLVGRIHMVPTQVESYIAYCVQIDHYAHLYKSLLKYLIWHKVATSQLRNNMEAYAFSAQLQLDELTQQTVETYIQGLEVTSLSHLMEKLELKRENSRYFTNLHLAAAFGSKRNILDLLKEGAKIYNLGSRSYTPLHAAVNHYRADNVDVLLAARAKINVIDPFGNTALHLACARRNPQMVTKLMRRGTDISIQNDAGDTPFHHALKHSCEPSAELFLPDKYYSLFFSPQTSISRDHCLDVDLQNKTGDTPLLLALKHDCGGIVRELLEYHADVHAINQSGNSCLHYAAEVDDYKTALELIYYRVNLNGVNSEGQTPLLIALKSLHVRIARLLLSKGAHVDGCDRLGMTCLHYAAQTGLIGLVDAILDRGVEVNRRSNEGETPLSLALTRKSVDIVLLLLKRGADPNIPDGNGCNGLHRAIEWKLMSTVNALVEHGCEMDHRDNDGDAPLFTALRLDAVGIVKLLLARGADASVTNGSGATCLHVATSYATLMEDFLKMGLDVNAVDGNGNTPLIIASQERRTAVMNLLIANGADILAESREGFTALHHAAHYGLTDQIVDLLNRGADINKKSLAGETPLSLHIRDWYLEANTTKLLLNRGAEIDAIDLETGNSLLHSATDKGPPGVVRALLKASDDLSARNNDGETALHLAIEREHLEITKLLLAKGADANSRNNGNDTCLHSAVATESSEMVMALLQYGAKTDATDGGGETPVSKAQTLGYSAIVNLLLKTAEKTNVGLVSAVTKGEVYTVRKLIEGGGDINMRDESGNTPLLLALIDRNVAISDFLLSKGADVTARNSDGYTALHYAADLGDMQIVREVLRGGCDIDAVNTASDSALLRAMARPYPNIAQLLLERNAKVELPPHNGKGSCLHVACAYGSEDLAARLLNVGLDADKFGDVGMTPLIHSLASRHRRIALTLIERGVDLNVMTDYGDSALSWAVSHQYCDIITLLIEKGVLMDYCDENMGSPLKTAIANEKREAVKLLLSRGCNVHLGNASEGYPLHAAAAGDLHDFVSTIIDNGFDVDKKTISERSALFIAADRGKYATTMALISNGASLDIYSNNFSSILCLAAKNGWEEMVEDLIKNGADIHHRNNDNETPLLLALCESRVNVVKLLFKAILAHDLKDGELNYLHRAAEFGDNQIVSDLLKKGFEINKRNDYGETPLLLAFHHEKLSTAKLLLAKGADRNVVSYGEALPCFHAFARFGWDDMVRSMLEEGVDVNAKSHQGCTPLHVATQNENFSTIAVLLAHGADPTVPSANDETPLEQCVRNHCKRTLKAFLEKIDASKSQKCVNYAAFLAVDSNHSDLLDAFIDFGVDNHENSYGESTLSNAIKNGYHNILRHLLDRNGNIDDLNSSGESLLMIAAKSGDVDMVKLLLERGADVTLANYEGETYLHLAACDTEEMLTLFLDGGNLEAKNLSGLTPLMLALKLSFTHSARLLISWGADIHTEDFMGNTCLHNAARAGDHEMVGLLLESGLDMLRRNAEGDDCLDMAINNGSLSVAKLLIAHGADPNQANRYGETCLLKAIEADSELVADFLAREVDVNCQGNDGHTPFTQALERCNTDHAKLLLAKNADVSVRNRQGSNLHYAITQGVDIVDALLDLGVDEEDEQGNTPLLLAVKTGALETAKLLLEKGADVRVKNNEYNTCLHYATDHSDVELLQMFLGKGIDVNCSNVLGETPLLKALKGEKLDHAKILLGEGADCSVVDNENGSCLVYCAQFGFEELLADFISKGHDVNLAYSEGSPLQMAFKGKHAGAVKLLLANGADIHSCTSYYETWVDQVIALEDVEIVRTILAQGIDVNVRLSRNEPLLITALKEKCRAMVDFLIAAGASVRLVSYVTGESCLHHAVRAGYEDIVGDLLDEGLDIDRENNQRETPLRVALVDGNCAMAKLLLSRGASVEEGNFRDSYLHQAVKLGDDSLVLDLIINGCELNALNADGRTPLTLAVLAPNVAMVNLLLEQGADFAVRDKADRNLLYAAKSVDVKELVDKFVSLGLADEEFENIVL
ncbi:hypothetical protein PPYR_03182 [Photinus pyralis]|uniref:Uncharacterized protein n=1 Tax=Photinus pyralis TaxID=7054 RepID=A0A5N4A238_PHOPY|nr:uncharacterized protein LOC116160961 [Photinus pyralis]KAB0791382.1 hypothetical protein PPYR_03182 [Photinus pyralis]